MADAAGSSDDSDTDSAEEGFENTIEYFFNGYHFYSFDSDVEHERHIDYASEIYAKPRDEGPSTSVAIAAAAKGAVSKPKVTRDSKTAPLVATTSQRRIKGLVLLLLCSHMNIVCLGLKLEYIHGYRGYDCRNNLYYLPDGA